MAHVDERQHGDRRHRLRRGRGPQRAEGRPQRRMEELVDDLRLREILEREFAQRDQRCPVGKGPFAGPARGHREERLPAVPGVHHPCDAVERRAEVVAVAQFRRPGVQAHPHADDRPSRPRLDGERLLRGQRSGQPVRRRGEGGIERVAAGLEDVAAVLADRLAQQDVVARQGHAHEVGILLPQPGAAFDVGEQEGDRPRRHRDRWRRFDGGGSARVHRCCRHTRSLAGGRRGERCWSISCVPSSSRARAPAEGHAYGLRNPLRCDAATGSRARPFPTTRGHLGNAAGTSHEAPPPVSWSRSTAWTGTSRRP